MDPKDSQTSSGEIHKGQAAPGNETRHDQNPEKRKFQGEHSAIRTAPRRVLPDDSTCAKCADLGLREALQKAVRIQESDEATWRANSRYGIHIADVGTQYRQSQLTDCALCRIISSSRISPDQGTVAREDGDEIRLLALLEASELVRSLSSRFEEFDSAFLVVVPQHFERDWQNYKRIKAHVYDQGAAVLRHRRHPSMFATQEVPAFFDAKLANVWLNYCQSNHSILCSSSTGSTIPGLRLIDCATLSVREAASDSLYVALSYVWGRPGNIDTELRCMDDKLSLPAKLSPVISDAISVAKALGFQYLWVDKFCIDQDDAVAKHQQIEQMNKIYENAVLTIVAAAGSDETYGLPGVGQRSRVPQKVAQFDELSVISTMQHPHSSIRSSRWASRGWTFQEAVLSRRRLVFTEEQLYFECNSMNCFESLKSPLDKLHIKDKSKSLDVIRAGMFGRGSTEKFGKLIPGKMSLFHVFQQYASAIQDYSSRDLTYDSDSLNAFRGIIQRYTKLKQPFYATWGMPYPVQEEKKVSFFCCALSWRHAQSCWENSKQPRRRQEFPSWTWAGWSGTVQLEQGGEDDNKLWAKSQIRSVLLGDGNGHEEILGWRSSATLGSKYRVLHLLAKALPPSLFSYKPTKDAKICWVLGKYNAQLFPSHDCIRQADFLRKLMDVRQWRCIWICTRLKDNFIMVLELNHDTGNWMRSGMFHVDCYSHNIDSLLEDTTAEWFSIE